MNEPKYLNEKISNFQKSWAELSDALVEVEDESLTEVFTDKYPFNFCFTEHYEEVLQWACSSIGKLEDLSKGIETQQLFEEFRKRKSIVPAKEAPQLYNDDECFWSNEPDGIRFCWTYDQLVIGIQNNGLYHLLIDRNEYQEESLLKLEKMLFDYAQEENILEDLESAIKLENMLTDDFTGEEIIDSCLEKTKTPKTICGDCLNSPCQCKAKICDREVLLIRTIFFLWTLLDNIDTADDLAKSNDRHFRSLTRVHQKRRWETGITTDGYRLDMTNLKEVDLSRDEKLKFK